LSRYLDVLARVVSDVKVDDVLQVGPLNADGEGVSRMEGEGNQPSSLRRRVPSLNASVNLELQQTTLATIKPDWVFSAGLGALHDGDPLLVVREETEVEEGGGGVALGRDGQLGQYTLTSLTRSTILRTDDGLLEALLDEVGVDVVAGAGRVPGVAVQTAVAKTVAKILEYLEELLRGVLVDGEDLRRLEVVHNEKRLLGIRLIAPEGNDVVTGVLDEQVLLVQQLHLPHTQPADLVEVLVKVPELEGIVVLF